MSKDIDYDALISQDVERAPVDIRSSLTVGSTANPDEEARLQTLSKKSGLPVEALRHTAPEVEKRALVDSVDYDDLMKRSPKVGEWLKEVSNAQVAHDDVQNLSGIERAFQAVWDVNRAFLGDPITTIGQGLQGLPEAAKAAGRSYEKLAGIEGAGAALDELFGDVDDIALQVLFPQRELGRAIEPLGKAIAPPTERRNVATDLGGGLGTLLMQAALPGAGTLLAGFAETKTLADRAREAGTYGTAKADLGILGGTVASYGLERLGLQAVIGRLPPKIKNRALRYTTDIALAGAGEGATESLQSISSDLFTQKLIDEDFKAFQSFQYEGGIGFGVGAIARGVLNAVSPGRLRFSETTQNAGEAIDQSEKLTKLIDVIQESKLKQRSPEAFESLVATFKQSGADSVGVPIEQLRTYAQTQNLAMDALVSELTGGTAAYVEASVTGGDVRIPVEKFLNSPHAKALVQDVRLRANGMTAKEAEEWGNSDAGKELNELVTTMQEQRKQKAPLVESSKKVYNDVYAKAIAAGFEEQAAAYTARAEQYRLEARASRLSTKDKQVDPYELYKEQDTQISNALQPTGQQYGSSRANLAGWMQAKFNDPVVEAFTLLSDPDESFNLPRSTAEDFEEVSKDMLSGAGIDFTLDERDVEGIMVQGAKKQYVINTFPKVDGEEAVTSSIITLMQDGSVILNIADNVPGQGGSAIYQAASTWANNNGYQFIEDPAGLSNDSIYRRPEQMLNSALRHASTAHLGAGPNMADPKGSLDSSAKPIVFGKDEGKNFRALIEATVANTEAAVPNAVSWKYDFASGKFLSKLDGREMTAADMSEMVQSGAKQEQTFDTEGKVTGTKEKITFGPNTIKRAIIGRTLLDEEGVLGAEGLRKIAQQRAADGKALPRVLYQSNEIFFSGVQRAINSAGLKKATAKQWQQTLNNAPGVKQEELIDTGFKDLLEMNPEEVYTKEQMIGLAKNGVLQVREVIRGAEVGDVELSKLQIIEREEDDGEMLYDVLDQNDNAIGTLEKMGGRLWNLRNNAGRIVDQIKADSAEDALYEHINVQGNDSKLLSKDRLNTKHDQYQEPGGKDYREIVLTLPPVDGRTQTEPYKPDSMHFTDEGGGTAIAWIRFNTRTDAQGNKVLYIEEIQSKRHQDGREKGYKSGNVVKHYRADVSDDVTFSGPDKAEVEARAQKYIDGYNSGDRYTIDQHDVESGRTMQWSGTFYSKEQAIEDFEATTGYTFESGMQMDERSGRIQYDLNYEQKIPKRKLTFSLEESVIPADPSDVDKVPDAPMKNTATWAMLAMKRMIRYAADNGFDSVAWTPGDVQNKRWSLAQIADEIVAQRNFEGGVAMRFMKNNRPVHTATVEDDQAMDELVGKDVADAVRAKLELDRTNSGIIFKLEEGKIIGGNGMRAFYDKMLVNETNKYIKKFGSKVEAFKGLGKGSSTPIKSVKELDLVQMADGDVEAWQGVEDFSDGEAPYFRYFDGGNKALIVDGNGIQIYDNINELASEPVFQHDYEESGFTFARAKKELENLLEFSDEFVNLLPGADGKEIPAHVFPITDKMKDAAAMGAPLYQQAEVRNAAVQFDTAGNRYIALFATANPSSLLHEFGHTWLEELRADALGPRSTPQLKADWESVKKYVADNGHAIEDDFISGEAHELFAENIERYFMEGKAPTPELNTLFAKFKDWLLNIYRRVEARGAPITPELRGVFDRLIATEEAIAAARDKTGRRATFATAKEMGVDDDLFEAYQRAQLNASTKELAAAEQEALDEVVQQQKEAYRTALAKNREDVKKELEARPEYRAIHWLRTGKLPDGTEIADVAHARLDAQAVKKLYANDDLMVARVRRAGLYSLEGGLDPEQVAPLFGYNTADQMLRALTSAPRMAGLVKEEAERRTKAEFGDMLQDLDRRANIALEAVHSDETGRVLRSELAVLRKLNRESAPARKLAKEEGRAETQQELDFANAENTFLRAVIASEKKERNYELRWLAAEQNAERAAAAQLARDLPSIKVVRDIARTLIGKTPINQIDREDILRNERAASQKSFEAALKKDYSAAAAHKTQQLLNHYIYLEASRAMQDAKKVQQYAKGLQTTAAQERIGKTQMGHLEKINALLEQYEFKDVSKKKVARRESLREWVQEQQDAGNEVAIPDSVMDDSRQVNYKELTYDELMDVNEALKNIEHLARRWNKILRAKKLAEYEETVDELLQALRESQKVSRPPPIDRNTITRWQAAGNNLSAMDATLLKAEQIFRWFDKDDANGVWMQSVFQPIADAQTAEMDLTKSFTQNFTKMFETFFDNRGRGVLKDQKLIPSIRQNMSLEGAISVALNTGNDGNKTKLMQGYNWNQKQLDDVLAMLSKEDWDFVQSVWNQVNELWPQVSALQKKLTGVEPVKVPATPVTTPFGMLAGGYYPLVYDPRFSRVGERQEAEAGEKLFQPIHVSAVTSQGHTKARTKFVGKLQLDLGVIPQHMSQVIHDLTHREAVQQAHKILNDGRVREEITNRMGLPYHRALNAWLKGVANDRNADQTGNEWWQRVFSRLRANASVVAMGFKFTTTFTQFAGYAQALEQVSSVSMAKATGIFWSNPMAAVREVHGKSGEMRNRANSIDRDMRAVWLNNLGKTGALNFIQRNAFIGIMLADATISTPTWMAAYMDATQRGDTEQEAIAHADSTVRLTQTAGASKDLASVQRGGELIKWSTMFYSYHSLVYNRLRSLGKTQRVGREKFMEAAWRSMLLIVVGPILGEILAGRGFPDDEEPEEWLAKKILLGPMMTIPIVRDLASTIDSGFDSRTPVGAMIKALKRSVDVSIDVAQGEREVTELAKPLVTAAGYIVGLPAGQLNITGSYLWDLAVGDEVPESAAEVVKNLMFRREE